MVPGDDNGDPIGAPPSNSDEFDPAELQAAQQYYADYIRQHGIESWGQAQDGYEAYLAQRRLGKSHQDALTGGLTMLGWDKAPGSTQGPISPVDGGSGGGTGIPGDGLGGGYEFTPPPPPFPGVTGNGVPQLPEFRPPAYNTPPAFTYDKFSAPTLEQAKAEPGYAFAAGEGERALQQSAAAKGLLNGGGTLKDILSWGNRFAEQNYGNVFDRSLKAHETGFNDAAGSYAMNVQSQYNQPYEYAYRSAMDTFQPSLLGYSTNAAANQRGNELAYSNAWDRFIQMYQQKRDRVGDAFNYFSM